MDAVDERSEVGGKASGEAHEVAGDVAGFQPMAGSSGGLWTRTDDDGHAKHAVFLKLAEQIELWTPIIKGAGVKGG